jgi:hypothetical protein
MATPPASAPTGGQHEDAEDREAGEQQVPDGIDEVDPGSLRALSRGGRDGMEPEGDERRGGDQRGHDAVEIVRRAPLLHVALEEDHDGGVRERVEGRPQPPTGSWRG